MATTLTRNLKLKVDSNLTANSKYNLERLDLIGEAYMIDTLSNLNIRSAGNIYLLPNSQDVGGSGSGGEISFGSSEQVLSSLDVYADSINFSVSPGFLDIATGGSKYLRLKYKSDINGSADTSADRSLNIDLDGSDRNLVLGGNLQLTGGNVALTATASTAVTLPTSGTLATLAGTETLTNKTLSANTISGTTVLSGASIVGTDNSPVLLSPTADGLTFLQLNQTTFGVAMDDSSNDEAPFNVSYVGNGGDGAEIDFNAASGTFASPGFLGTNNTIMALWASAWNGSGPQISGTIRLRAESPHSGSNLGSRYQFDTATDGTTTRQERLRISSNGVQTSNAHFVVANQAAGVQGEVRLRESSSNGTDYTGIRAAASVASSHTYTLPSALPTSAGQVLACDTSGNMSWVSVATAGAGQYEADWTNGDGATKVVSHMLGSTDIDITIVDLSDGEEVFIDQIVVTNSNTITLFASEAPATTWRVIIQANI